MAGRVGRVGGGVAGRVGPGGGVGWRAGWDGGPGGLVWAGCSERLYSPKGCM